MPGVFLRHLGETYESCSSKRVYFLIHPADRHRRWCNFAFQVEGTYMIPPFVGGGHIFRPLFALFFAPLFALFFAPSFALFVALFFAPLFALFFALGFDRFP